MIGILNEKPSQARNFAAALGGMKGTFDGESYVIVPARGHLYGFIDDPSKQVSSSLAKQYHSWDVGNLPWNVDDFQWKYGMKDGASATLQNIKKVLSGCDEIVLATDDDPTGEGSLLGWEIIFQLGLKAKKYTRMFFADESEKEIRKAFKNRKLLGTNLSCMYQDPDYKQAIFRTKWDYMSMQWTRIACAYSPFGYVPRQGRLKSAMVRLVGDQLKAIAEYVEKPYYEARFRDEHGVVYSEKEPKRFEKKEEVPIGDYTDSPVICDSKTIKHTAPPKFMDLAGLSSLLAPRGVSAKAVLSTYQKMYEAKIVSYPRTEDKCITIEQFKELLPHVDKIAGLLHVNPSILTHKSPRKTHVKTGMAHGANRPGSVVPNSLDDLVQYGPGAREIYVLLATNYLQTLCEDYEYEQQKGHLEKYPTFLGTANVPKKMGWKQLITDEDDLIDDNKAEKGLGSLAKPFTYDGVNPKPQAPTMKWLMKQLEKHDVGTGATRTSIYADVTNKSTKHPLLVETRGKLTMAEDGDVSYVLLPNTHIGSLDLTETVLKQMKEIYKGQTDGQEYLKAIADMVRDDILVMQANSKDIGKLKLTKAVVKKDTYTCQDGPFAGKSFARVWAQYVFSDEECERLAKGETITIDGAVSSKGQKFSCTGKLAMQKYKGKSFLGFSMEDLVRKNVYTCQSGPFAGKMFSRVFSQYSFSDDECEKLAKGESITIDGAISSKGQPFACEGKLEEYEYNGRKVFGFKVTSFVNSATETVPATWCGHKFTKKERAALEQGEEIFVKGFKSKAGKKFDCYVAFKEKDSGRKGIVFNFDRKK